MNESKDENEEKHVSVQKMSAGQKIGLLSNQDNVTVHDVTLEKVESDNKTLHLSSVNLENATNSTHDLSLGSIIGENSSHSQRRLFESGGINQQGNSETHSIDDTGLHEATVKNNGSLEGDADESYDIFRDGDTEDLADEYNYDYDDYVDESMWGDEEWTEVKHEKLEDFVNVDSHILGTPV